MTERSSARGWDPTQYLTFEDQRLRPALDLLSRVPTAAASAVYDLGCGTGHVTRLLAERWPGALVVGLDSSPAMLARAGDATGIRWIQADLATWSPPHPADVIYSNAALHWLDDHPRLFPRLVAGLRPGGILAVQMPRNHDAPSHILMVEAAADGPWRDRLAAVMRPRPVAPPAAYYDILAPHVRHLDVWETIYLHVLEGQAPVVAWTRGSALKPLLDALEEPERSAFLAAYTRRVALAYPARADGRTLFPFRRLFLVATR